MPRIGAWGEAMFEYEREDLLEGSQRTLVPTFPRRSAYCRRARKYFKYAAVAGLLIGAAFVVFSRVQPRDHWSKATVKASEVLDDATLPDDAEAVVISDKEEEAEEHSDVKESALMSVDNMDPHSTRLRWKGFPDECLIAYGDIAEQKGKGFLWTVWHCKPTKDAWFRQRYLLPAPGDRGQIKSAIGQVTGEGVDYCLTVPACVVGTPVQFRPCEELNDQNTFVTKTFPDGTIQIRSPSCPPDHCIDVPDQNITTGNPAQIWECSDRATGTFAKLLKTDETFSVGISQNDLEVFDSYVLTSNSDVPDECQPLDIPNALGKGLDLFEVRCPLSDEGSMSLQFGPGPTTSGSKELDPYAAIWMLWCDDQKCRCKAYSADEDVATLSRQVRSTQCGVLMLAAHPPDGTCPLDLEDLQGVLEQDGKVDCMAGKRAVADLQNHRHTKHRIDLRWIQTFMVGLLPQDLKAFETITIRNSSGVCNATETTSDEEAEQNLEVFEMKCPAGPEGAHLGIEMTKAEGEEGHLSNGAAVWTLWCTDDQCNCDPATYTKEMYSARLSQGDEGCGAIMLNSHSKFGACPQSLKEIKSAVEGDDEVDCGAGKDVAVRMSSDPANARTLRLKWVYISRDESALSKVTKQALDIFSVIGGVVVIGTVPAWPAVTKFAQFLTMMASNHAELGLPDEFNGFAHKFTEFDKLVKPLKKIKLPGLKDLGISANFMASSRWFIMKENFMNQTMQMVLRVYRESGMLTPGVACFLAHYYDPVRQDLRDVSDVLKSTGGNDPCDYSEEEAEGILPPERRLAAKRRLGSADEDDSMLLTSDGGTEAVEVRKRWSVMKDLYHKQIEFLKKAMSYSKKEFSVTKNLLFCLLVLPVVIGIYCLVYVVLSLRGNKLSYIPFLQPTFLLLFMADLVLLNVLMAWANVVWRRRILQCENPFILLDQVLTSWDGISVDEPITSLAMAFLNCFRPIIRIMALIPPLHVNLAESQRIAMVVFILGPCLIFLVWFVHFLFSRITRHPESNYFMDQKCTYIKGCQPVVGLFKKQLYYEPTEVSSVKTVIATDADGKALYRDGKVQVYLKEELEDGTKKEKVVEELQASSKCAAITSICKGIGEVCAGKKEQKEDKGVEVQMIPDDEFARKLGDENVYYASGFRVKNLSPGYRGFPEELTVAFENRTLADVSDDEQKVNKPHMRLRLARGNQLVSVIFEARSNDPKNPMPVVPKPKEPKESETAKDREHAAKMAMAKDLLQSTWRRLLLERLKGVVGKVELGYLRWTMWDDAQGCLIAAFTLELIRPSVMKDQDFVDLGIDVKKKVETFMGSADKLLQSGWAEASKLVQARWETAQSTFGTVEESKLWFTLAQQAAKATLTAEEVSTALPEVDLNNVYVKEESKAEDGEQAGVEGAGAYVKINPAVQPSATGKASNDDPKVAQFDPNGEPGRQVATVALSFADEQLVPLPEVDVGFIEQNGKLAINMKSALFKTARRGDIVEVFILITGEKDGAPEDAQTKSWTNALKGLEVVRLFAAPVNAWDDPRDHFGQLAVLRKELDPTEKWCEVARRFPQAFVGKVEVPIKLQDSFGASLGINVGTRDLLRLSHQVPLRVSFSQLQLEERDRWRAFYMSDYQKKKSESPQLVKIINGLNIFFMVFAVVLIPKSVKGPEHTKEEHDMCPKGATGCDASTEFKEMTDQVDRQTEIATGISHAMIILGFILIVKVVINSYQDGDLKNLMGMFKGIKEFVEMEWAYLKKIFQREKREEVKVVGVNYARVMADVQQFETFSRVMKQSVNAHAEAITLEMSPGPDGAVVFAKVPTGFPVEKKFTATLGDRKVDLLKVSPVSPHCGGCVPSEEGDGITRALGNYGGSKMAGLWFAMKDATTALVKKAFGSNAKDEDLIYSFEVKDDTGEKVQYDELADGDYDSVLLEALTSGEHKAKSAMLTCTSVKVVFTIPAEYSVSEELLKQHLNPNDEEVKKFLTTETPQATLSQKTPQGFIPSWVTFSFVIGVLKLLLIIFIGALSLANGSGIVKALFAIAVALFLWMLSRLVFESVVDGMMMKSSTLELGQVALILLPLLAQGDLLEPVTCSVLMIIGVLWALVTLCCKYLKDTLKKYQKEIEKFLKENAARLQTYAANHMNSDELKKAFDDLMQWLKVQKLKFQQIASIKGHALGANTRDPAWCWKLLFAFLFVLCVIGIATLQSLALTHLSQEMTGSADTNRQVFQHEIPILVGLFLLSLGLLALAYWALMVKLPDVLQEQRNKDIFKQQKDLADKAVEAVWDQKKKAAEEDKDLQQQVLHSLFERARAFRQKEQPVGEVNEQQSESYTQLEVVAASQQGKSVLLDPLGVPVPVSTVPIFADDGASILEGDIRLSNGNLALKRLLCTEWAWRSPRYLVQRTPVQVNMRFINAVNDGEVVKDSGIEPVPTVGFSLGEKKQVEVLVCTLQIVNFVGLTLGATDKNDGILSLWREPELSSADQLSFWFQQVRRFFADYGASFEKDSRVYGVLESLFWGVKVKGSEGAHVGSHVEEHKRSYMVTNEGKPYLPWVYRNMDDLVKRIGPNRPDPHAAEELEDVSDDEQQYLEEEAKKAGKVPAAKAPEPKPAPKEAEKTKGMLTLVIRAAKNLPNKDGSAPSVSCVVKTPSEQTAKTQTGSDAVNPEFDFQQMFSDFEPGTTEIAFTVSSSSSQVAKGTVKLRMPELKSGEWLDKELNLETDPPTKTESSYYCCSKDVPNDARMSIRVQWTAEDAAKEGGAGAGASGASGEGANGKEKFKRSPYAQGFCGGPLAWQLLYPPAQPQLLHIAVTSEDLRCCPTLPDLKPFGRTPALGKQGYEPLLRETRAMGREPNRGPDDTQDLPRPESAASAGAGAAPQKAAAPPDMSKATAALDTSKKNKLSQVVKKGNVSVDEKKGQIIIRKAVDFEPRVRAREGPTAEFLDKGKAMEILRDVAGVLEVYSTAQVAIEGHTSTKDSDLDDYAFSLARNRAAKVKAALEELGISGSRMTAEGKPGKHGTGKKEVLMRVTSI